MPWRLVRFVMLALLVPPLAAGLARGQGAGSTLLPIPTVPDFTQMVNSPQDIEQVQAKAPVLSIPISPNTGVPVLEPPPQSKSPGYEPLVQQALKSSDFIDPRYIVTSEPALELTRGEKVKIAYQDQVLRLFHDFRDFYRWDNLKYVGIAVLVAAPIANTHADQGIRNWYQGTVRPNSGVDAFADAGKQVGDYKYAIPAYVLISLGGHLFPDNEHASIFATFGDRSLRAMAVGAPAVGILGVGLGAGRPDANNSHWQPLQSSHSVSGHAFVGAIPFLTAAEMVENRALKAVLVVGSTWTGWSCIHTDDHYFSQVLLGWSIAYLATQTVAGTDMNASSMRIVPMMTSAGMGMGVEVRY